MSISLQPRIIQFLNWLTGRCFARLLWLPVSLFASLPLAAAPIEFYPSLYGQSSGDTGEGRWTYFELLSNVKVTELGVVLNPGSPQDRFLWEVYSVETSGALLSAIFQTTVSYVDDDILSVKDVPISLELSVGNYVIGLTTLDAPWQIAMGNNSVSGGYFGPGFITADGNFRLWDAGVSSPTTPLQSGNSGGIPGFSLNIEGYAVDENSIPEPSALALVGIALALLGVVRRQKRI